MVTCSTELFAASPIPSAYISSMLWLGLQDTKANDTNPHACMRKARQQQCSMAMTALLNMFEEQTRTCHTSLQYSVSNQTISLVILVVHGSADLPRPCQPSNHAGAHAGNSTEKHTW